MVNKYALAVLLVSAAAFQAAHAAKVVEVSKDNRRMSGLYRSNQAPVKTGQAIQKENQSTAAKQAAKAASSKR